MNVKNQIRSPIVLFILLLFLFELFFRLPYVLNTQANPHLNRKADLAFFSDFNSGTVVFTGLMLLACAFVVTSITVYFSKKGKYSALDFSLPKIPILISLIALILSGLSLYMISQLTADVAYIDELDLSGKRSFSDSPTLYAILRLSMFNHIVIALAYVRAIQTRGIFSWICFLIPALIFLMTLTFISHRALLFVFVLEIVYFQILLKQINLRRILTISTGLLILILIITVMRTNQEYSNLLEAFGAAISKVIESRFFFDFTKLGVGYLWSTEINWIGPVSISFFFEPFFNTDVIFYKDLGKILSRDAYNIHLETGVTPGGYLESVLSFGVIGGGLFFGGLFYILLFFERRLFEKNSSFVLKVYTIMILSKIPLFLNSSFGAFCFQLLSESLLFMVIIWPIIGLRYRQSGTSYQRYQINT